MFIEQLLPKTTFLEFDDLEIKVRALTIKEILTFIDKEYSEEAIKKYIVTHCLEIVNKDYDIDFLPLDVIIMCIQACKKSTVFFDLEPPAEPKNYKEEFRKLAAKRESKELNYREFRKESDKLREEQRTAGTDTFTFTNVYNKRKMFLQDNLFYVLIAKICKAFPYRPDEIMSKSFTELVDLSVLADIGEENSNAQLAKLLAGFLGQATQQEE